MKTVKLISIGFFMLLLFASCGDSSLVSIQKVLPFISTDQIRDSKFDSIHFDSSYEYPIIHFIWMQSEKFDWLLKELGLPDDSLSLGSSDENITCASELLQEDALPTWWPRAFGQEYSRHFLRYWGGNTRKVVQVKEIQNDNGFVEVLIRRDSCYVLVWEENEPRYYGRRKSLPVQGH
jgi:hypothetical protein